MFFYVSGLSAMNKPSTWTDITSYNFPLPYSLKKIQESALIIFGLHSVTKYLANSLRHNIPVSTFPYIDFYRKIQYSYRNYYVMIPKSTMPSGHLMNISTSILGCRNAAYTPPISTIHTKSSWYKVSPLMIFVEVSDVNGKNDSVKSTTGT